MLTKENIKKLVDSMTNDIKENIKKIEKAFGSLKYQDDEDQSILHILVDDLYAEEKCFLAIKSLLASGMSPNLTAYYQYNFIQTALYAGYSENFIVKIIEESLKYGLNVNHEDCDFDSIMHTAILSDDYHGGLERIYLLLCKNGFKKAKKNGEGQNLVEAMIKDGKRTEKEIESFRALYASNNQTKQTDLEETTQVANINIAKQEKQPTIKESNLPLSEKEIEELEKYGRVLNRKKYLSAPTIGREKELKNLIVSLAGDKKKPIVTGESGVGKTALVEELAYRIINDQVPNFLRNKIILEISPSEVVAGCQYVGQFEEKATKLLKLCEKYDVILFIDEIHTIYGVGTTTKKDTDFAAILKHYIDRSNLKIIGTTTEKEYEEYFANDALKRRFEKIIVKEPTTEVLYEILDKVIDDYFLKYGITFETEEEIEKIIQIIINLTERRHRVYNDMLNNPDLAISIIDKAYAFAKVYDSQYITAEHFAESIEYCDRIYDSKKADAINELRSENIKKTTQHKRVLKLSDFNTHKK